MSSRKRASKSDQDFGGLLVLVVFIGLPWWLWTHAGVWRYPLLLAAAGVLGLLVFAALRRRSARRAHQALLDQQYAVSRNMTGTEFEHLTVRLLRAAGWADARRVGGAGDLGADVIATHGGRRLVVQCKRWDRKKIGSREIQTFLGTCYQHHQADIALFVTTSVFTPAAQALAETHRVATIDGEALAAWQALGVPALLNRRSPSRTVRS